jgi:hypothetical protein
MFRYFQSKRVIGDFLFLHDVEFYRSIYFTLNITYDTSDRDRMIIPLFNLVN